MALPVNVPVHRRVYSDLVTGIERIRLREMMVSAWLISKRSEIFDVAGQTYWLDWLKCTNAISDAITVYRRGTNHM